MVINDASWLFEFDQQRKVGQLVSEIKTSKNSGRHTNIIKKLMKESLETLLEKTLTIIEKPQEKMLLDGNHHVLAIASKSSQQKHLIKCIIGSEDEKD